MKSFHTCLTVGPIQLFIYFYYRAPCQILSPLSSRSDAGKCSGCDDHVEVSILVDDESVVASKLELTFGNKL